MSKSTESIRVASSFKRQLDKEKRETGKSLIEITEHLAVDPDYKIKEPKEKSKSE